MTASARSRRSCRLAILCSAALLCGGLAAYAQSGPRSSSPAALPNDPPDAPEVQQLATETISVRDLPRNLLHDQAAIWTSPARLNESNAIGPAALVLATTVVITTDHEVMSSHFQDKSLNDHASTAANALVGGFVATPALMFGVGHLRHNNHAEETGILAAEAVADSLAVSEVIKLVSLRERPPLNDARGRFFQTSVGFDSSFPSNHTVVAWSSASVIASEYNGTLTKLTAYGFATGVSVARVVGRAHFPSDVLVGSAVGWMIGRYVFRRHSHSYSGRFSVQ